MKTNSVYRANNSLILRNIEFLKSLLFVKTDKFAIFSRSHKALSLMNIGAYPFTISSIA